MENEIIRKIVICGEIKRKLRNLQKICKNNNTNATVAETASLHAEKTAATVAVLAFLHVEINNWRYCCGNRKSKVTSPLVLVERWIGSHHL